MQNEIRVTLNNNQLLINKMPIVEGPEAETVFDNLVKVLADETGLIKGYYLPLRGGKFAEHTFYIKDKYGTTNS